MSEIKNEKSVTEICDWLEKSVEHGLLPDEAAIPKVIDAARRADLVEVDVESLRKDARFDLRNVAVSYERKGWNDCIDYLLEQGIIKNKN